MKYTDLLPQAIDKIGSCFLLCNIASQRIKQLENGAEPKIFRGISDTTPKLEVALREIIGGKLEIDKLSKV
ncbi:MAG: DNA-directed RNA polymerase subunit omega [Acidobacteria bacterium]|nr:DNA-directed RNA polymerase subunit omega [Acidobacteriota bacterium]MBI3657102.1 DNA-directed RNA polymerase subunit omega [Acidobacteriota bacterium]